ncbi:MAG: hypothetical protein ABI980_04245 [Nitrospirota bacterium]
MDITGVVARPLVKTEPEQEWVDAEKTETIPPALYRFYINAEFFSLGRSPKFLADSEKMLFPYVGALARGILESLREAEDHIKDLRMAHEKEYTPIKKAKGREWDPKASEKALRSFKHLVVTSIGVLDQFAEIVSIFFCGEILNLQPGRASFEDLRKFSSAPLYLSKAVISPRLPLIEKLHSHFSLEITKSGAEKEWLELLLLYRNKLAHLGNAMFWRMGFHTEGGECFDFLPNRWPLIFESEITAADESSIGTVRGFAEESLIHQDMIEYSQGLLVKIKHVLNGGFEVLCEAYLTFKNFDVNPDIPKSIKKHSKSYEFRYFEKNA